MPTLPMTETLFSENPNADLPQEFDAFEQARFLDDLREALGYDPSNKQPIAIKFRKTLSEPPANSLIESIKDETSLVEATKNDPTSRWALSLTTHEVELDLIEKAYLCGMFPDDCRQVATITPVDISTHGRYVHHHLAWNELALRLSELGIYLLTDDSYICCSHRLSQQTDRILDHNKYIAEDYNIAARHICDELDEAEAEIVAQNYFRYIINSSYGTIPLFEYDSSEVRINYQQILKNATFGELDTKWPNRPPFPRMAYLSSWNMTLYPEHPQSRKGDEVLSAFGAATAQRAFLHRFGIRRLSFSQEPETSYLEEILGRFDVVDMVREAYADKDDLPSLYDRKLMKKLLSSLPEDDHEQWRSAAQNSRATIDLDLDFSFKKAGVYTGGGLVNVKNEIGRCIGKFIDSCASTGRGYFRADEGISRYSFVDMKDGWNARLMSISGALNEDDGSIVLQDGDDIGFIFLEGSNLRNIDAEYDCLPILCGVAKGYKYAIIMRLPWNLVKSEHTEDVQKAFDAIPNADVLWDESGLFKEEKDSPLVFKDERNENRIVSNIVFDSQLIEKLSGFMDLSAAIDALKELIPATNGNIGIADYATQCLTFGKINQFPLKNYSYNPEEAKQAAHMIAATRFLIDSQRKKYDILLKIKSVWEGFLAREGLALVLAFPFGLDKQKLWDIGYDLGIDSAVEALLAGVPLEYLIEEKDPV